MYGKSWIALKLNLKYCIKVAYLYLLRLKKTNYHPSIITRLWKHFIGQGKFLGIMGMDFFYNKV